MDDLPRDWMASLDRAVVHHGHARMQRFDDGSRARPVTGSRVRGPVMRGQVKVHGADQIVWACERQFLLVRQIAQINESELAERDQHADRACVLAGISTY